MRLFIAEKPSLGRAIAQNLPAKGIPQGPAGKPPTHIVAGDDVVTWCYGHLLESLIPEEYNDKWKSWNLNTLPIKISTWRLKPRKDAKLQLSAIGDLLKKASVVVNAEFNNLSQAALCRSKADWLVGMNLSRAATKLFGRDKEVISVGRVQTPTLALAVNRDLEIENFKPQTFYTLIADVKTTGGALKMEPAPKEDRILDKKIADQVAASLKGKTVPLTVVRTKKSELAPTPYMLATFQKDAEKHLGMGAKKALDALQQLYEAKLTSYPRTDHEHLPPEQASDAIKIASAVIAAGYVTEAAGLIPLMQPSKRIYSLPKNAEHHGLVPTGQKPAANLPAPLLKAYELVCKRFILSLLPNYEHEETAASFVHEQRKFACTGEVPLNAAKS